MSIVSNCCKHCHVFVRADDHISVAPAPVQIQPFVALQVRRSVAGAQRQGLPANLTPKSFPFAAPVLYSDISSDHNVDINSIRHIRVCFKCAICFSGTKVKSCVSRRRRSSLIRAAEVLEARIKSYTLIAFTALTILNCLNRYPCDLLVTISQHLRCARMESGVFQ